MDPVFHIHSQLMCTPYPHLRSFDFVTLPYPQIVQATLGLIDAPQLPSHSPQYRLSARGVILFFPFSKFILFLYRLAFDLVEHATN